MWEYDREEVEEYDDYEGYEEQQEEEGESEDEYEDEEERKPSAEELEYLELRERFKQQIREKRLKENGSALTRSQDRKKLPFDNFGSFFGPSQPVIAQRVIQESKALLENPHLAARLSNSNVNNRKSTASGATGPKHQGRNQQSKVKSEVQTKVQKLKDVRDYSFLLSDDAELPAPKQSTSQRNIPRPNAEGRGTEVPQRNKQPSINGRSTQVSREDRRSASANSHMQSKVSSHKVVPATRPNPRSVDPRRQIGSNAKTVQGQPSVPKPLPSKTSVSTLERKPPAPGAKSIPPATGAKSIPPATQKPMLSRPQSSVPKKPFDQRDRLQETIKSKMVQARPVSLSKPQVNQPVKRVSSHSSVQDNRPKKKPFRRHSDDEDDEGEKALSIIRRMFKTDRYANRDDSDSDMEANFDDIMKEERRSARIAKKEDEEQQRLNEEEERRERMRKLAKKQKR